MLFAVFALAVRAAGFGDVDLVITCQHFRLGCDCRGWSEGDAARDAGGIGDVGDDGGTGRLKLLKAIFFGE